MMGAVGAGGALRTGAAGRKRAAAALSGVFRAMSDSAGYAQLGQLGRNVEPAKTPNDAELERVPNQHPDHPYVARFTCPEFTSLCPVTGQPDFAHIVIDYIPAQWLLESKSLKLYLHAFRNHGDFHEACTMSIATRIRDFVEPTWLRIGAYWYPRGGIPIDVFYQTGDPPAGVWIPSQGDQSYRGRGAG